MGDREGGALREHAQWLDAGSGGRREEMQGDSASRWKLEVAAGRGQTLRTSRGRGDDGFLEGCDRHRNWSGMRQM